MAFLSKDQILAAQDRRFVDIEVPEWGGTVRLASLTAQQAMAQEALAKRMEKRAEKGEDVDPMGPILAASIVDENGEPVFAEKDMAALSKKNPAVLMRLVGEIGKLNSPEKKTEDAPAGN